MSNSSLTIANLITLLRVVLIVPLCWFLHNKNSIPAFVIFSIISLTDFLDGYFARKLNQVTDLGKLLDPLVDKMVVIVCLFFLVENFKWSFWLISPTLASLIVIRELAVTGLRSLAASKAIIIPADNLGKIKTVLQLLGIGTYLCAPIFSSQITLKIGTTMLWLSVIVGYAGMINYFYKFKNRN